MHDTLFQVLRRHARERPDALAVVTPYRSASYRKMWSRVERSTARLQGEWGIRPGDTIVYFGCGHLDALVMYLAAARCGARLLPLEHAALQEQAGALLATTGATLLLHDDALTLGADAFAIEIRPLSTLIATVCRHRESVEEDTGAISLLEPVGLEGSGSPTTLQPATLLPASLPPLRPRSLDLLTAAAIASPAGRPGVTGALFDAAVFAPIVLASLLDATTLTLGP